MTAVTIHDLTARIQRRIEVTFDEGEHRFEYDKTLRDGLGKGEREVTRAIFVHTWDREGWIVETMIYYREIKKDGTLGAVERKSYLYRLDSEAEWLRDLAERLAPKTRIVVTEES